MEAMVFACSLLVRENPARSERGGAGLAALDAAAGQGLKEVARVVALLGGLVLYAGLLAVGSG